MTGAASGIISLLDHSETPVITASMYATDSQTQHKRGDVLCDPRCRFMRRVIRYLLSGGSRWRTHTHARRQASERESRCPDLSSRSHCLNPMVAFRMDVTGHFHWCAVSTLRCARSVRLSPALHMLCRSTEPAEAETVCHNVAGSEVPFTETRGAFFRKSLALNRPHVIQAGCL